MRTVSLLLAAIVCLTSCIDHKKAKEEVSIVGLGLVISEISVFCKMLQIAVSLAILHHLGEQGRIPAIVVAVGQEIIITSERSVSFKVVVAIQTELISKRIGLKYMKQYG